MKDKNYIGDHRRGEIEIVESHRIFENKYASIFNDDVIFPGGHKGTYLRFCQQNGSAVAVLPITKSGRVLLIKNFRHGARGWGLEVPKGGVENGESASEAALRELYEETGYTSSRLVEFGEYCDSPAVLCGSLKCYIAFDCQKSSEPAPEETESIERVVEADARDFTEAQDGIDFADALTELLIYKYMLKYGGE